MSRIYDAIQCARETRSRNGVDTAEILGEMALPERRATPRKDLGVDLTVYGRSSGETAFYEQARAIMGNANGGVLLLGVPVLEGQDLLLINNGTSQEQICNIVSVCADSMQNCEVMVSFLAPNPDFWKPSGTARKM
jgi:hypothetical protein